MLERFVDLQDVLPHLLPSSLLPEDFDSTTLQTICKILKPLQEATLALQNEKADAALAVKVINFLRHMKRTEPALKSPISVVLLKWIDSNSVVNSLFHNNGTFSGFIREKVIH